MCLTVTAYKKLFHFIDTMNGNFNKIINIDFSCQIFQKEI